MASDPVDFVTKVARIPRTRCKGHVVLAPPATTDFAVCGAIAAAFMGCFLAAPKGSLEAAPRGVTYKERCRDPARIFRISVPAGLAEQLPKLTGLLGGIAQAPGNHLHSYLSEEQLEKDFERNAKNQGPRVRGDALPRTGVWVAPLLSCGACSIVDAILVGLLKTCSAPKR